MRYLIRFLSQGAAGSVEHYDKIVDDPTITIGRATDQVLHLKDRRARLQHARIEPRNGDVHISTRAIAGVTVNGRSKRDAKLQNGDVIEVGSNILTVIEAPPGFDFAMTFELSGDAASDELASQFDSLRLSRTSWSKRRLSWVMISIVLVCALIVPAAGLLHPGVAGVLRNVPLLPDDGLWQAGPIHNKHSQSSTECQHCHTEAFRRVKDVACLECHDANRHVSSSSAAEAVLGIERCGSCHLEHNEPPGLVKRHQGLCADCHSSLTADAGLERATDFLEDHPAFKVSLLQPIIRDDETLEWMTVRAVLADTEIEDRSHLNFNHQVHLDKEGIITPDGRRVIECGECHLSEPGGARMAPVTMDEHCSQCHTLTFDPDEPDRTVPHGDPEGVMQVLIEYYSARLLSGSEDSGGRRIRRPGQALSRADRDRIAAEATTMAFKVAGDIFERTACATCHQITRGGESEEMPWHVLPVRLTKEFFPKANFSHADHDTEVSTCVGCHAAESSETTGDILIPKLEGCRDCHGSGVARRNTAGQTLSTCIMCHSFHFADKGSYR